MDNKTKEILSLDLKNVKNILDIKIKPKAVLIEAVSLKKSGLLGADGFSLDSASYWKVIKVGVEVTLTKVGDIVLDMNSSRANFLQKDDARYMIISDYDLEIWVDSDNYIF